jgi:hypothetical protein
MFSPVATTAAMAISSAASFVVPLLRVRRPLPESGALDFICHMRHSLLRHKYPSPRLQAGAHYCSMLGCCDREEDLSINKTTLNTLKFMAVLHLVL